MLPWQHLQQCIKSNPYNSAWLIVIFSLISQWTVIIRSHFLCFGHFPHFDAMYYQIVTRYPVTLLFVSELDVYTDYNHFECHEYACYSGWICLLLFTLIECPSDSGNPELLTILHRSLDIRVSLWNVSSNFVGLLLMQTYANWKGVCRVISPDGSVHGFDCLKERS